MKSRKLFAGCLVLIGAWLLGACAASTDSEVMVDPEVSTEQPQGVATEIDNDMYGCNTGMISYCAPANCWCCTSNLSSCTQYAGNCKELGCRNP